MRYSYVILGLVFIVALLITKYFIAWNSKTSVTASGNTWGGFDDFPEREITVDKAIELATPYLDKSYKLRLKSRAQTNGDFKTDIIHVSLKDDFYYIVKDDYPSYTPGFYLLHAIKINTSTGYIIEPE